jgi:hypothetical protein
MTRTILVLVMATACNQQTGAFELDHARFLAVRSEPAHALAGASVRIDVLAGDGSGDVYVAVPDQVDADGLPVALGSDGWYVQSPDPGPNAPTATVTMAIDGQTLVATKQLVFGDQADNPVIDAMQLDGAPVQSIDVSQGDTGELDATALGDGTLMYAWYTSIGTLMNFRVEAATLEADAPGDGIVVAVVRDDQGGVAWTLVPAQVR